MAMCCALCMFGSCKQCACLARDTCVLVARSHQSLPWIQPSPFPPPPAQLPPAFPLQTAESRDRLTASWVTMNSVGQCWKVCWTVCWTVLCHHGCLACFSFCCNTCELEPRDGPRASVFPRSSKRQQGGDCLFFCESPSVCLFFCGCADHH